MASHVTTEWPDLIVTTQGHTTACHATGGDVTIGRGNPPSDMSIEHPGISRLHVRLIPGPLWQLIDYESLNGIYLAGRRLKHATTVTDGMNVRLGHPTGGIEISFRYVYPGDITAPATLSAAGIGPAESDRYARALAQLQIVLADIEQIPAVGHPDFARTALAMLQRLVGLQTEFHALITFGDHPDAQAYLTAVKAMYDGLLLQMSRCDKMPPTDSISGMR